MQYSIGDAARARRPASSLDTIFESQKARDAKSFAGPMPDDDGDQHADPELPGRSSQTLNASLDYVDTFKPVAGFHSAMIFLCCQLSRSSQVVITDSFLVGWLLILLHSALFFFGSHQAVTLLENVAKVETGISVQKALRQKGYVTRAFFINSSAFQLPQSRTRLYIVAVNPRRLRFVQDPATWAGDLEAGHVCIWAGCLPFPSGSGATSCSGRRAEVVRQALPQRSSQGPCIPQVLPWAWYRAGDWPRASRETEDWRGVEGLLCKSYAYSLQAQGGLAERGPALQSPKDLTRSCFCLWKLNTAMQ